jgi:hypothetical protein
MFGWVDRLVDSRNRWVVYVRDLIGQSFVTFYVAFLGFWALSDVHDFSTLRAVALGGAAAGVRAVLGLFAHGWGNSTSAHFSRRFR